MPIRLAALFLLAASCFTSLAAKPYRFLLVISDQWKDPSSFVIEGGGEFQVIAASLKTWGLPFDILRLDQQRIDRYHLLDRDGEPRYGTIIWSAGPGELKGKGADLVPVLVKEHGVGLVILGDSAPAPEISSLTGSAPPREHFTTRGLSGALPPLAIREFERAGRVVWLRAHIQNQLTRDLFKRCLVWVQGYAVYAEYPKSIVLEMHDMGTSEKTLSPRWHYRSLTEQEIRAAIIEPLKKHNAVVTQIVNTGYVDRKSESVLEPWKQQRVVDPLDGKTVHDYASTKRGLDAGQREGVFEIQSHGWTHMLPDLDSPPGPFWTVPLNTMGGLDWYNEFGDRLRKQEVPAATQRFHLQRSIEYLRQDFGVTPVFFRPGGGEFSRSYANHTGRVAAQLGFGLARLAAPVYLAHDLVISLESVVPHATWAFDREIPASGIPWTADGPYFLAFHDRDVAMDSGAVERLLNSLGSGVRYMTAGEYTAYLHAEWSSVLSPRDSLSLVVDYDDHYCRYFASHPSTWTLHLSDETQRSMKAAPEKQTIQIPSGPGRHVVRVGAGPAVVR